MSTVKNIIDPLSPLLRSTFDAASTLVPLKALRQEFLEDLFLYVEPQSLMLGQVIFELGAIDNQYIFLHSGQVLLSNDEGKEEVVIGGDFFIPLAHEQPRAYKAEALSDCIILRVDEELLDRTLSWSQLADHLLSELSLNRENDDQITWMKTVLSSNLFFKVPPANAEQIFECLQPVSVSNKETVISEGDTGDCCYFMRSGSAKVVKAVEGGEARLVAEISEGRCFGEDALVESRPRNASVTMTSDGELMKLDKEDFQCLLIEPECEEVTFDELETLAGNPILVDVRTDDEYRLGHLAYSANIPMSLLALKKRLLSLEQTYVFYCDTGRRSRSAAYFLGKEGYNTVSLAGGISAQKLYDRFVQDEGYILRDGRLKASVKE